MPFSDHIGPNRAKASSAWGSRSTSRSRKNGGDSGLKPKIVVTPKSASFYPKWTNIGDEALPPESSKQAKKSTQQNRRRQPPKLASSTAKPREKPLPKAPVAGAWREQGTSSGPTPFKVFYDRGDIPCRVGHGAKRKVHWKCNIADLDYAHYLPLFFEGLRDTREPYCFLSFAGVQDLLYYGGDKVLPIVPQLIQPLRKALNTKNRETICRVLQVLQQLCEIPFVGEALVPYYRSLLPVFNLVMLLEKRRSFGDRIDYGQQKKNNIIDLMNETLEKLEETGGEHAFVNIKYMVPCYENTIQH